MKQIYTIVLFTLLALSAQSRPVDIVTVKELNMPQWHLIKTVRPDVLIVTEETVKKYGKKKMAAMKKYCGEVRVLEPMATTSTSAKIRRLQLSLAKRFEKTLIPQLTGMISSALVSDHTRHK